ncbi:MAG: riboflavin biosynthesis protein RibF [Lachnospiraceae bacterium]
MIGKFDGVHRGHQSLLQEILKEKENGLLAAVFTFDPAPESFFRGEPVPQLTTKQEKRKILEDLGVDVLIEYPFDKESAAMPPEDFVREILAEKMKAKVIAAGPDLSFGDRGAGNFALLHALSWEYGFETRLIRKDRYGDHDISSTLIRSYVEAGRMEDAAACLGSPYFFYGTVAHGNAKGRTIGFPTLNLYPDKEKILPPFGVYYSDVTVWEPDGTKHTYRGMTDVGKKPTVREANKRVSVETFVYDFDGDLYGRTIRVELLTFERSEQKFADFDALKKRILQDVEAGREYFRKQDDSTEFEPGEQNGNT